MFDPSSQAIIWILGGLTALLVLILLITSIATLFVLMGAPHDLHDVRIDEHAPIKDRKTNNEN